MQNNDIAKIFRHIAELLSIQGENPFKIRAYDNAALTIENLQRNIEDIYKSGGLKALEEFPGIGKAIAEHIEELIKHGKITKYQSLLKEFPEGFTKLLDIPGVGPKTAVLLLKKYKINNPKDLEKAIKKGLLKNIPGFKEKKIENIAKGIELKKKASGRYLLDEATSFAEIIVGKLSKLKQVQKILPCGSLRRGKETIGDLDILVISKDPGTIMDAFVKLPYVKRTLAKGPTKSSVILENKMQADIRVVEEKSFGAAAHYFTGCKEHNIHIRQLAQEKGWKVSEYGIFKGEKQIGGQDEEDMFSMFGLQYIPPELREMRGEFEAAKKHQIPKLIKQDVILGDLHAHTTATDGQNTILEMAQRAKERGYEYIAITDHSKSTTVARGLSANDLLKHIKDIRKAQEHIKGIKILAGSEVDILRDGSLDYPDEILKELDIVVASIHSSFKLEKSKMTERVLKALENKYVNILGHPTGRLIGDREAYELDISKILRFAKENHIAMELNSHPHRLDLMDIHCKQAKELGVKIAISTDAHSAEELDLIKYGIITARRGWLESHDVLNTLSYKELSNFLSRRR